MKVTRRNKDHAWRLVEEHAHRDARSCTREDHGRAFRAGYGGAAVDMTGGRSRPGLMAGVLFVVLAVVVLALVGCSSVRPADRAILDAGVAVNVAHGADEALPPEARAIALDAAEAFAVLRYSLTGEPLPPALAERLDALRAESKPASPEAR